METPPLGLGEEQAAPSTLKLVDVPYDTGTHTYLTHSTMLIEYRRKSKRDDIRFVWGPVLNDVLFDFLASSGVELRAFAGMEAAYEWRDTPTLAMVPSLGAFEFDYAGAGFVVVAKPGDRGGWFLGTERLEDADRLFRRVKALQPKGGARCMVYGAGSGWAQKDEMLAECARTKLDRLTFPDELRRDLRATLESVFGADAARTYDRLGLPRKRGVILHGPPGNGKTSVCKAVVADLGVSLVYVSSTSTASAERFEVPSMPPAVAAMVEGNPDLAELESRMQRTMAMVAVAGRAPWGTGQSASVVEQAFKYAQEMAPCVVVLEEIDAMVEDGARGALLTALDGLVPNEGVLTIATTNHLDALDAALRNRPSRFDRVLRLPSPAQPLRERYLRAMVAEFAPGAKGMGQAVRRAAAATEGMSFAHLQEIVLGFGGGLTARERPAAALGQSVERVRGSFAQGVAEP